MRAIFLSLERLYRLVDGADAKPWVKHEDAAARDKAVSKFVMGRLQIANAAAWPLAFSVADDRVVYTPKESENSLVFFQDPLSLFRDAIARRRLPGSAGPPSPPRARAS